VSIQCITDGGKQKDGGGDETWPSFGEEDEQDGDEGYGPYAEEGKLIG
jgi:hypothetical protein